MLKVMSITFRLTPILKNNKNFGLKNLAVGSFSKLLNAKEVTNCQFNRFASKALDISNHQPTLPTTSIPTKQTDKVTVGREGSEQSTRLQSANDETNKTSEGSEFDKFIEELEQFNGDKPINGFIRYILDENEIYDVSSFAQLDLDELIKLVVNDMIIKPEDYKKICPKLKFSLGNKILLKNLIQKAKENTKSNNLTVIGQSIKAKKFVDKTKIIESLLTSEQSQQIIVIRPRRFGKTYFLRTIAEICKGKQQKHLFKDYAIGKGDYDWQYYPVIFLSLSELSLESMEKCEDSLRDILNKIAIKHDLKLTGKNIKQNFAFLIQDLEKKTNKPVVILIDEYDTPIVRSNENEYLEKQMTNLVKDILETCKSQENFIKLLFVTGIRTCCLTGMHSGPNHLSSLTYSNKYASVFGFTEDEIKNTFKSDLERLKQSLIEENNEQLTNDDVMIMLKKRYHGYYFSSNGSSVYNPWTIMQCFEKLELNNYWFNQIPPHLIDRIVENKKESIMYGKIPLHYTEEELQMDQNNSRRCERVLLESGYLTLNYSDNKKLTLNWPNSEIEYAFDKAIITKQFEIHPPFI